MECSIYRIKGKRILLTGQYHSYEKYDKSAGEEAYFKCDPWRELLSERRHPEPLHGSLTITMLQISGHHSLGLCDEPIYIFTRMKNRRIDVLCTPFGTNVNT